VSPDVYAQLTGRAVDRPTTGRPARGDRRQARALGVRDVHASDALHAVRQRRFYSHRAGDPAGSSA
jgi:hypothetical protein